MIILLLINLLRSVPLVENAQLDNLATFRAEHLSQDFKEFAKTTGCYMVGENVTQGFTNPQAMLNAEMSAPEHKKNLLAPYFQTMGVGTYQNITVELFCYTLKDN